VSQGLNRRIVVYLLAVLVTAAFAVVAFTIVSPPAAEAQYNAGRGNASEPCPPNADCDPGNSGGNQGGD